MNTSREKRSFPSGQLIRWRPYARASALEKSLAESIVNDWFSDQHKNIDFAEILVSRQRLFKKRSILQCLMIVPRYEISPVFYIVDFESEDNPAVIGNNDADFAPFTIYPTWLNHGGKTLSSDYEGTTVLFVYDGSQYTAYFP